MSLRQLTDAATARMSSNWDAPSAIWALIAETHRDRKARREPYTAADIHPFAEKHIQAARPWKQLGKDLENGS